MKTVQKNKNILMGSPKIIEKLQLTVSESLIKIINKLIIKYTISHNNQNIQLEIPNK